MTRDVLLTLSLMLSAALAARFLASLARIPEILLLVLFGALLGPSMLDVIDVPLDSLGAQLIFTLGVSMILSSTEGSTCHSASCARSGSDSGCSSSRG